ncbi:hypothetical protein ACFQV2_29840 [Actinokineospora soli]|uniref:Roadblock/LAMTOR2 domain-containing protein n=1 Tax=Actinokineospora soli TaxID=1048753 RepID=A0ABW2TX29_9PSEU
MAPDDAYLAAVRDACAEAMDQVPELVFLAYLRDGRPLVKFARGDDAGFTVLAKQMAFQFAQVDDELQKARTGRLIRVVLRTDGHALCYDMVRPGEEFHGVVAVSGPDDPVEAAGDKAVAALASRFRAEAELRSANYGAYEVEYDGDPPEVDERGGVEDRIRSVVKPEGVHFASYWADGKRVHVAHCFDDDRLSVPFDADEDARLSPHERYEFHVGFSRSLRSLVRRLRLSCGGALRGKLNRVVLDVEAGAVYYVRLSTQRYLTTVTLEQSMVHLADEATDRLARSLRAAT